MKRTRPPAKPPPGEEGSSFLRTQKRLAVPQDDDLSPTMNSYRIAAGTGGAKGDNFMEHKARTKALSWLLSLAMVLSLLPGMSLTAYAAELATDTTTWENSDYVVPAGGVTISGHITVNGRVKLTLTEGTTLTANAGITLSDGATLNVSGTGTMVVNGSNNNASSTVAGTGKLVLKSGTLTAKGGNGQGLGDHQYNIKGTNGGTAINGSVIVNGGTLTATGGNGGSVGDRGVDSKGGNGCAAISGNLTVNGGTMTATNGAAGSLGGRTAGCSAGAAGAGYSGTLTLGAGVKLYEGTEANETKLLDGNDSASRVYESEKKAKMFAVGPEHAHEHSFASYTVNTDGNTITATCTADGCTLPPSSEGVNDHVAKLTIAAPQHTAVGDGKSADAQITDEGDIQGDSTVSYFATDTNGEKTGSALGSAPTEAGKYWAEITLSNGGGDANDSATAHVVYTITDPEYNITPPTDLVGGSVTVKNASGGVITTAHYGDTITLDVTPDDGFAIKT